MITTHWWKGQCPGAESNGPTPAGAAVLPVAVDVPSGPGRVVIVLGVRVWVATRAGDPDTRAFEALPEAHRDHTNHLTGTVDTHSGSRTAFCGGNSLPPLIQMNVEDWARVSVVIARTAGP